MRFLFCSFFLLFYLSVSFAHVPHIEGTITLSVKKGTLSGQVQLTNIPESKDLLVLLNKGLDVSSWKADSSTTINAKTSKHPKDEASVYTLPKGKKYTSISLNYSGTFPVQSDFAKLNKSGDWKGNIAFNGTTVRASEQALWYPAIYNSELDKTYNRVTYNLKVNCEDCERVYVNGSQSQEGKSTQFTSGNSAYTLLLFAGEFKATTDDGNSFLNTKLYDDERQQINDWIDRIKGFYSSKLKIPYGEKITFVETTPVSQTNSWAFVTFPSIVMINHKGGFSGYFNPDSHVLKDTAFVSYIAHELGHYYYGHTLVPNSSLRWMFLEGVTSYLSLKCMQSTLPERFYNKEVELNRTQSKKIEKWIPLDEIKNEEQIDVRYRYYYVPLVLSAIEKEIGEDKMWNWLNYMLTHPPVATDYAFLRSSMIGSGISAAEFEKLESKYIKGAASFSNVVGDNN